MSNPPSIACILTCVQTQVQLLEARLVRLESSRKQVALPGTVTKPMELPSAEFPSANAPALDIHPTMGYSESLDRVRIPFGRTHDEMAHRAPATGTAPRKLPAAVSTRSLSPVLKIPSETMSFGELGHDTLCLDPFLSRDGRGTLPGNENPRKEMTRHESVHSICPSIDIHRQVAYMGENGRVKPALGRVQLGDGHGAPPGSNPRKEKLPSLLSACSFVPGFEFHRQYAYFGVMGQARSSLARGAHEVVHYILPGRDPRMEQLNRLVSTRSICPGFCFHQQIVHLGTFDRGVTTLVRVRSVYGHTTPPGSIQRKAQLTSGKSVCLIVPCFWICWPSTTKRGLRRHTAGEEDNPINIHVFVWSQLPYSPANYL